MVMATGEDTSVQPLASTYLKRMLWVWSFPSLASSTGSNSTRSSLAAAPGIILTSATTG